MQAGLTDAALDRGGPVREAQLRGHQAHDVTRQAVVSLYRGDGFGNLVAVGTHVLHGGRADGPGDAGEGLDAGQSLRQRPRDELVPDRTRVGAHEHRPGRTLIDDGGDLPERLHVHDRAFEGRVGGQQVRSAAHDEQRAARGVGRANGLQQGVGRRNAHVLGDGPTHAQGRQISKGRHAPKPSRTARVRPNPGRPRPRERRVVRTGTRPR